VRFHYRLGWVLALSLARALFGFRARGSERVPAQGAAIVASNHVSGWDPLLVGLAVRREVHFLAKEELFRNPLLRWLITAYNALPVRRGGIDRRALRASLAVLEGGGVVLLFPEGTRSASGELLEPKAGVGFLASRAGAIIVPAYIAGSGALGNAFLRRRPVEVTFGNALPPGAGDSSEAYRATAERTMEEVRRLKEEVERR
jgi:1-acyl-sn-glycerol-3-phosphate acyltransferase